jgi:hypothetical protein
LLTVDGPQVPVILLFEVVGNKGTDAPAQMVRDELKPNNGVVFEFTFTVNVVVVAH